MHTNPEVLALLALGEDSATADERAHVETCSVCTREVAELAHLAGVGRAVQDSAPLSSPRAEVWDRIRAEIGFEAPDVNGMDAAAAPPASVRSTLADLTDPTPVDRASADRSLAEHSLAEHSLASPADHSPTEPHTNGIGPANGAVPTGGAAGAAPTGSEAEARPVTRGRRRILTVALAAAIALVLGVGIGLGWNALSRPTPTVIGQADLIPLNDTWAGSSGEAVLERNAAGQEILTVRMSTPRSSSGYRQVWMMNGDGAMVPVGIITGDEGEWTVPVDIEAQLPLVDVSEEPRDGNPLHSGNSILRGTLNV